MPTPRDFVKQDSTLTMQQHCEIFLDTLAAKGATDTLFLSPIVQGPVDVNVSRCTVRVKTTVWADKRGLHTKKSLTFLRRQCEGFNILAEDISAMGVEEVLPRIVNLDKVKDGIYEVVVRDKSYDYETGYVDDYDYRLVTANAEFSGAAQLHRAASAGTPS